MASTWILKVSCFRQIYASTPFMMSLGQLLWKNFFLMSLVQPVQVPHNEERIENVYKWKLTEYEEEPVDASCSYNSRNIYGNYITIFIKFIIIFLHFTFLYFCIEILSDVEYIFKCYSVQNQKTQSGKLWPRTSASHWSLVTIFQTVSSDFAQNIPVSRREGSKGGIADVMNTLPLQ